MIRRRVLLAASVFAAAALVLVVGRDALSDRTTVPLGDSVAVVEQVDGGSQLHRDADVRIGQWIETGRESRIALRFGDGTSVRLDTGSRMRALSPGVIELSAGAVYVDSGHDGGGFEVRTPMATARDIGTQFEVRLTDQSVRLRVRTGIVELRDRAGSISGRPGTEITLSATGAATRAIAAHGSEWQWTTRVSPPLHMEGTSLAVFLERVAREQGWSLEYGDPTIAREAQGIILHGTVSGLSADDAVGVAIATSGLSHRLDSGSLVVRRDARNEDRRGRAR